MKIFNIANTMRERRDGRRTISIFTRTELRYSFSIWRSTRITLCTRRGLSLACFSLSVTRHLGYLKSREDKIAPQRGTPGHLVTPRRNDSSRFFRRLFVSDIRNRIFGDTEKYSFSRDNVVRIAFKYTILIISESLPRSFTVARVFKRPKI